MAVLRQPTRRGRPQQCQEDKIMLQKVRTLGSSSTRRSFLRTGLAAPGVIGTALIAERLPSAAFAASGLTSGDASILRFLSALEILETDLWQQYNELGGIQDQEVPGGSGNKPYTEALSKLDADMPQYIHDNTEDEFTHFNFINAYLMSKGAEPVNLDRFRTLQGSTATGAQNIRRRTNLMQLTVDTRWWTRYRSRTKNPDFGDTTAQAIPTLAVGQHPAIPRTDADTNDANFIQAIANTAGFHFAFIEQGGSSLYPQLAQRVSSAEVLRIVLSIGGTEICHFQTWHDKAGNAIHLSDVIDPVTGVSVTFPDLNSAPFGGENFQTNLIMPEPCPFISRKLPPCSVIRPTETKGIAKGVVKFLTDMGLFIGQSPAFFALMQDLAADADAARHGS